MNKMLTKCPNCLTKLTFLERYKFSNTNYSKPCEQCGAMLYSLDTKFLDGAEILPGILFPILIIPSLIMFGLWLGLFLTIFLPVLLILLIGNINQKVTMIEPLKTRKELRDEARYKKHGLIPVIKRLYKNIKSKS